MSSIINPKEHAPWKYTARVCLHTVCDKCKKKVISEYLKKKK